MEEELMRESMLILILGMGLVTFLPRFIPMAFLSRWVLPEKAQGRAKLFPGGHSECHRLPHLLHRWKSGRNSTPIPSCGTSGFSLCLEGEESMGFCRSGNADLLGTGIHSVS